MLNWNSCDDPNFLETIGRFVEVAPYSPGRDAEALFQAISTDADADLWRHIPFGPFESSGQLGNILRHMAETDGWQTLVFRACGSHEMLGMASYMRIRSAVGSAEVGSVVFSKRLQKTPAATEAMYFMARHLFDDRGYRRYEWKCDNDNLASKQAATRFGFSYEGLFRQDMVAKGKNRDTAWFSMIDGEWPNIKAGFEAWLAPENFDIDGNQIASLVSLRDQVAG